MLFKYGNCTRLLTKIRSSLQIKSGRILTIYLTFFNETIIPLAFVGYETIIANSSLRASLATAISFPSCYKSVLISI